MYRGKSVAVVVPAYNESRFIVQTLQSVPQFVDKIYAVDDASADDTLKLMLEQSEKDKRITVIARERNGGVGAAIVSGYEKALADGLDIVAVMAGDGQMDPQYLPALLDPIIEGRAEYVKGNRLFRSDLRRGMSTWRYFGNVTLTFLNMFASGYWHVVDPQNGYTAITARALRLLNLRQIYPGYAFENDMLVKLNVYDVPVMNVPIPAKYGEEKSKISYGPFIVKALAFFLRSYFWRIRRKYLSRREAGVAHRGPEELVSSSPCSALVGTSVSGEAMCGLGDSAKGLSSSTPHTGEAPTEPRSE